jgi:hypothetical protein
MALERWIAGQATALAWTDAFTLTTLNSIANGNAILSDITIVNDLFGDMFADLSIRLGNVATFALPAYVGVYLYPANTYNSFGDGRFAASAAGPPPSCYWVGDISLITGNVVQTGSLLRIPIPPGPFRFVLYNQGGVTLSGGNQNTCQYRTYNLQLV